MQFLLSDCEVITARWNNGTHILKVTHNPTGKVVRKEFPRALTEGDRVSALQEMSDLIEGRKASDPQLLVEGA